MTNQDYFSPEVTPMYNGKAVEIHYQKCFFPLYNQDQPEFEFQNGTDRDAHLQHCDQFLCSVPGETPFWASPDEIDLEK